MKVPFLDLSRLHESIRPELDAAFDRVVKGSSFIGGDEVAAFEAAFAEAHDLPAAVGCGSGTDALALALRALGLRDGDEVVVPSMTFVATAEAVVHAGGVPVVADVSPDTLLLDEESVDAVRTDRTRAVIPVHLYGHVVPFDTIRGWRDSGLLVLEDAAQAHVATWEGELVGHAGHAVCFSFYPGKNLGALGDAGMVLSTAPEVVERARILANHGRRSKYLHDELGWCSRLDGLQAALLNVKLSHLPAWTAARQAVAARYAELLPDGPLVPWTAGAVHHLLVARVARRDAVQAALRADGIGTGVHYPASLAQQPWLASLGGRATPHADRAADEVLSLPMDPLMTGAEVEAVVEALVRALAATG
ncbi:MAG TPA: DegT/DnrJ/EryC1/StrS family aminotransferase [Acidimicrobiales bacterium]|nr:DegT/DnrJ/EryC1/StrS family aminotransferase [Acidimicrobiales bacterium]